MALKAFATGGSTPDSFAASFGGWKFYTIPGTPGIGLRRLLDSQSLLGQFRQNNDGPGWTSNRTATTPDAYRPIPFKEVVDLTAAWAVPASGYYIDTFDDGDEEAIAEDAGQLVSVTLDISAFLSIGAAPPITVEFLIHEPRDEYPHGHDPEDAWWGNVFGFPDQALDVVPTLFPPAAPSEPIETFAAQPTFGEHDYATTIPVEIEDYLAPSEQLEFLAPPEVFIPELLAAQPQPEVEWTQTEFEDYANDTALDVTPQLFPPVVAEPIETFAAQPLAEQPWFPDTELEDYQAPPEQNEWTAPPEVNTDGLIASQPHYGEAFWPEAETEDYQADATLDLSPFFFPTAAEAIEVFAAQPHYGEWWWDEQATEDYAADTTVDVTPHLVAGVETIETLAAAGYTAYQDVEPAETLEDYQHTSTLDVAPLVPPPVAGIVELAPSYTTFHDTVDLLTPDALEDYQHTSTIEDVAPFAAPPPAPIYLTEGDADATVGMQSDGGMGDALEHDANANAGAEADDGMGGSIESAVSPITGLES
jgi:hypothetical protein